jgi:hypothetical protein
MLPLIKSNKGIAMNNGKHAVSLTAGLILIVAAVSAPAQDWPQWRGPNRDDKVSGFTAPKTWPQEFHQKWKVSVGQADATPALVGDKLFVFSRGWTIAKSFSAGTPPQEKKFGATNMKPWQPMGRQGSIPARAVLPRWPMARS